MKLNENDRRFKLTDFWGTETFYRIPKLLITNPLYKEMSNDAKLSYGIFQDRFELSLKNRWVDNSDSVYFYFTVDEMQSVLKRSKTKVIKIKSEMSKYNLLEEVRQGINKPNRFYLLKPKKPIINAGSLDISGSPFYGLPQNGLLEVHEMDSNDTEYNYTEKLNDTSNDTSKEIGIDYSDLFINNFNREFITKKTIEKLNLFGDVGFAKELIDIIFQTKYQVENYREHENQKLGISTKETGLGSFKLDGNAFSIPLEEKVNEFILQNKLKIAKDQKINNLKSYFRVVMRTFWENCLLNDDFYGVNIICGDWEYQDFFYGYNFESKEARHNFIYGKERTHYSGQLFLDFLRDQKIKLE